MENPVQGSMAALAGHDPIPDLRVPQCPVWLVRFLKALYVIITKLKLDRIHGIFNMFYLGCSYDRGCDAFVNKPGQTNLSQCYVLLLSDLFCAFQYIKVFGSKETFSEPFVRSISERVGWFSSTILAR
jgi:hypothetical protein